MRNAGLEEAQAGIKTAGRNNNNLRCADDITLMSESEEELKSLLMKMKEDRLPSFCCLLTRWRGKKAFPLYKGTNCIYEGSTLII